MCLQLIFISRAKVKDFSSWKMRRLVYSKQQIVKTGLLSFKLLLANFPTVRGSHGCCLQKLFAYNT